MMKAQTSKTSIASAFFAAALALTMMPAMAFAADTNDTNDGISGDAAKNQAIEHKEAVDNSGDTEYWLQLEKDSMGKISIDVPVRVVLAVNADGSFVTPTALKNVIENKSEFPVNVSEMDVTPQDDFALKAATGFDALTDANIFSGTVASVDGDNIETVKQSVAFSKIGEFAANVNWAMQESDGADKTGDDCLFIQVDGKIANVSGHYFTAPINVFDITYTFEATQAKDVNNTSASNLLETAANITD